MTKKKYVVFVGFLLAGISVSMTTTALPQGRAESGLVVRLLIPKPKSCTSSEEITAEVVLRNPTSASVAIPLGAIGSGIHYSAYSQGDIHSPGLATLNINSDPWPGRSRPPKEVTLHPGESYWLTFKLALDRDFFSKPGIYDVSIDLSAPESGLNTFVGPLESNKVYFELEDCGQVKSK
jgi:hypothetical protein